ncbi:MAG: hypothetical protein HQL27_09990 [Candidatus Omnitrophica bacterium]|nr:hypothetical protein [Candidatus Omnitrophota bacterium]
MHRFFLGNNNIRTVKKYFHLFTALVFLLSSLFTPKPGYSQTVFNLPDPGMMVTASPAFIPPIIAGMTIHPENPLQFDFVIDSGDDKLQGESFKKEAQKLINYFMASLAVPEDEMWVNLSPYEKNRIVADGLGKTELGRDMLLQDYMLKQLAASLMFPEAEIGLKFWEEVYSKADAKVGMAKIPADIFSKIWIMPDIAAVYVNGNNVFVAESHLKVMLDKDYLALNQNFGNSKHALSQTNSEQIEELTADVVSRVRKELLPVIEKEVNEGKNFANLRQMYNSMILAAWYKNNLRESIFARLYANQNKVKGIDLAEKESKEKIYNQYMEAFKKGVYDYVKEDYDSVKQEVVTRKYFSGGLKGVDRNMLSSSGPKKLASAWRGRILLMVSALATSAALTMITPQTGNAQTPPKPLTTQEALNSFMEKTKLLISNFDAARDLYYSKQWAEAKEAYLVIGKEAAALLKEYEEGETTWLPQVSWSGEGPKPGITRILEEAEKFGNESNVRALLAEIRALNAKADQLLSAGEKDYPEWQRANEATLAKLKEVIAAPGFEAWPDTQGVLTQARQVEGQVEHFKFQAGKDNFYAQLSEANALQAQGKIQEANTIYDTLTQLIEELRGVTADTNKKRTHVPAQRQVPYGERLDKMTKDLEQSRSNKTSDQGELLPGVEEENLADIGVDNDREIPGIRADRLMLADATVKYLSTDYRVRDVVDALEAIVEFWSEKDHFRWEEHTDLLKYAMFELLPVTYERFLTVSDMIDEIMITLVSNKLGSIVYRVTPGNLMELSIFSKDYEETQALNAFKEVVLKALQEELARLRSYYGPPDFRNEAPNYF